MSIGVGSDAGAGVSAGASPSTGMVSDADNDWTEAIGLIRDGLFDLNPLITHRFALSECAEAFRVASDPNIFSVKVMFVD
jgi:threonine dehydrogenase-like Zn-dependent dehydrogenase